MTCINTPLKNYTTFKTGGDASAIAFPKNLDELKKIFNLIRKNNIPYYIIGGGSNILISDKGFDGIIIKLSGELSEIRFDGTMAIAGGGASLIRLSRLAMENGLAGLEFACAIPGTVGGAVMINAGAHGEDISGIINEIHAISADGTVEILKKSDINWGYRRGAGGSRCFFTTIFDLNQKMVDIIKKKMDNCISERNRSQPKGFSAGSIFKNPSGDKAYRLIIEAGFGGACVGDAVVSDKHANFIINRGNASSSDIFNLITQIQNGVRDKFGVNLETEIQLLGEF